MKTSLKKNKKFLAVALAVLVSMSCLFGLWTVVYAQEQSITEIPTKDEAVQTEVEVNVKYIFEDEKIFKEEKIKAEKGQLIDSGDLPMLPDDMKFIDEFLFYEVKGDGKDEVIRKVAKIEVKDKETQTEAPKTEDKGKQTEITKDDISKMEKQAKELKEELDKLNNEIKDKDKLSDNQKDKIKELEAEIKSLKEKLKKESKDVSPDVKKEIDKLTEKIKELEKKANQANKAPVTSNPISPISPISGIKTSSEFSNQTPVNNNGKGTTTQTSSGSTAKDTSNSQAKEKEVRYPNKLAAKAPANNSSPDSSIDGTSKSFNTNKGVASAPSKARASVTENKDNANKDYPIHHNDDKDKQETDKYSADARQFITFQTKNGKTFYLIINHDEDSENVMLLTEVSEDDLLNMVEKKETPKQEITKEEPVKEEKPEKKEEKSNLGTYIILSLVIAGALGAGYYFKVVRKKEDKVLEAFEEEDDDFFSGAEVVDEEISEVDESEVEDKDDVE